MRTMKRKSGPKVLVVGYRHFRPGFLALFGGNPGAEYADKEGTWDRMSRKQRARYAGRFDLIHYFWAKVTLSEILRIKRRRPGIRIIFHFIGSDVLIVGEKWRRRVEYGLYRCMGARMFADDPSCVLELGEMGLPCRWLPFVNGPLEDRERPLPKAFSAIAYVPENNESFYRLDWILEAARRLPDIRFTVFPNDGASGFREGDRPPNVRFAGRLEDVPEAMAGHSVFLRLPRHDGLPSTLLEALSCARQVIWTHSHPFCHRARDAEELIRLLKKMKAENRPNRGGKSHVLKTYSIDALRPQYEQIWRAC